MGRPIDRAYIIRERKRRADPNCETCHGEGVVTYTARNLHGEEDSPCPCLMRAGDFEERDAD